MKSKYEKSIYVPCSGKEYAKKLARLIQIYVQDREKEIKRHEKAIKKIQAKINGFEKEIRDMGNDAFSDEIITIK